MMSFVGSKSCIFFFMNYYKENDKFFWFNLINKLLIDLKRFLRNLGVFCKILGSNGVEENLGMNGVFFSFKNKMEDYNIVMKRLMRSLYEYYYDFGMNMIFRYDLVSLLFISNKDCFFDFVIKFCSIINSKFS